MGKQITISYSEIFDLDEYRNNRADVDDPQTDAELIAMMKTDILETIYSPDEAGIGRDDLIVEINDWDSDETDYTDGLDVEDLDKCRLGCVCSPEEKENN